MFLVSYKIFISNDRRNLIRSSIIPEILKKHSYIYSDFEILSYINFGICLILGKVFALSYLSYGMGKAISGCVDSMINSDEIKREYSNLNNNFIKNNDTIRNITSQKLMTGKNLSKKERGLIKTCKENQTILEHKQFILEEKHSKCQVIMSYITLPFKFLFIIILVLLTFSFILSTLTVLIVTFNHNFCGFDCGYLTQKIDKAFSMQSLLSYLSDLKHGVWIQNAIVGLMILFVLYSIYIALKNNGIYIFFYSVYDQTELKNNKKLTMVAMVIFFIIGLSVTNDIIFLFQDFVKYGNLNKNCILTNFDSDLCGLSLTGMYMLKFNLNFPIFSFLNIVFNLFIITCSIFFVIFLPVVSAFRFFSNKGNNKEYKPLRTKEAEDEDDV